MKLTNKIYYGIFIRRDSRFSATVKIGHRLEYVFVPNSGRLRELLKLGREVYLTKSNRDNAKTRLDMMSVVYNFTLVSIDSRVPNRLFLDLFNRGKLRRFNKFDKIKSEARFGKSRFDFLLSQNLEDDSDSVKYYLEVKSVSLVNDHCAMFPDAPTERGIRHLRELIQAKKEGHGAGIVFFVQRNDAKEFRANPNDAAFSKALKDAFNAGVDIFAYTCHVTEKTIRLAKSIPVRVY